MGEKCLIPGNPPQVAVTTGSSGVALQPHYCPEDTGSSGMLCTTDRSSMGRCFLDQQFSNPLPTQFQYFTDNDRLGGYLPAEADYCPLISQFSTTSDGNDVTTSCRDPNNAKLIATVPRGMLFGSKSICLDTTLQRAGTLGGFPVGCYEYECSSNPVRVFIYVPATSGSDRISAECTVPGQDVTFEGYAGVVTCPLPSEVCEEQLGVRPGPGPGSVVTVGDEIRAVYSAGTVTAQVERVSGSSTVSVLVRTVAANSQAAAAAGISPTLTEGGLNSTLAEAGVDYTSVEQTVTW